MNSSDPTGTDWTDSEVDLIVADYIDMLRLELSKQSYVKLQRNEALQRLTGRSHGSIEFKHRNISAVMVKLGFPWIYGYKPLFNYQTSLLDGIERYLQSESSLLQMPEEAVQSGLAEEATLFMEPPPMRESEEDGEPKALKRLVRKFDPAKRDARNRKLGRLGEELVFHAEKNRLVAVGRPDLARQTVWVSEEHGDGAGYDILSFEATGEERLLEVKTTTGGQTTPFYISENERSLSVERSDAFRLVRLYDFSRAPRAFQIEPPLESALSLHPTNYRASF